MRLLCLLIFSALLTNQVKAQKINASSSDSVEVMTAINGFLDAFTNLKWEKFTAYFADDATAFFPPSARTPSRANNKTEIEQVFKNVFENFRKGKKSPPYLDIQPKDVRVQVIKPIAIVTFHLRDPGFFGRRTIMLRKEGANAWKIVHLHASAIAE